MPNLTYNKPTGQVDHEWTVAVRSSGDGDGREWLDFRTMSGDARGAVEMVDWLIAQGKEACLDSMPYVRLARVRITEIPA